MTGRVATARLLPVALCWALAAAAAARAESALIAPADGRIALQVDGQTEAPQRYLRHTGTGAVCETASWDGPELFGEVGHCEAVGDRYWRRGYVGIDLLMVHFPFLADFLTRSPMPDREVDSAVGPMTLYAFAVEDLPGQNSDCNGFARGYDSSGTGFHAFIVGYVCADRGILEDARADALLRGLSVRGAFPALVP